MTETKIYLGWKAGGRCYVNPHLTLLGLGTVSTPDRGLRSCPLPHSDLPQRSFCERCAFSRKVENSCPFCVPAGRWSSNACNSLLCWGSAETENMPCLAPNLFINQRIFVGVFERYNVCRPGWRVLNSAPITSAIVQETLVSVAPGFQQLSEHHSSI